MEKELNVTKLTKDQVIDLRSFKERDNGRMRFWEYLKGVYKDEPVLIKKINDCMQVWKDLEWITTFPAAQKTLEMYFDMTDEILGIVGYTGEDETEN